LRVEGPGFRAKGVLPVKSLSVWFRRRENRWENESEREEP